MKNIAVFYLKIFSFLEVKFSIYLNRRVFVMIASIVLCTECIFGKLKDRSAQFETRGHAQYV